MKVKGINRKLDKLGRLCLPKEFRDELGIKNEEAVEITLVEDGILIKANNSDGNKKLKDCTTEELIKELERRR